MKWIRPIAIGFPLVLAGIAIVSAVIYFLGEWSLLVVGVVLFSWCVGDAVISHREIRALGKGKA